MSLRPHRLLVGLLLSLATWTAVASIGARWIDGQLLSRPGWASTSHRLIANREVRRAIATFSVDQAFGANGIDAEISRLLPGGLASAAQRQLHRAGASAADRVLSSRVGRRDWERASDRAQSDLLAAIDSPGARRGVVLNLSPCSVTSSTQSRAAMSRAPSRAARGSCPCGHRRPGGSSCSVPASCDRCGPGCVPRARSAGRCR